MDAADEKPKPQFFRIGSSIVTDGAVKAMTGVDLKVHMVLALHANWTTGKCWPSYKTIRSLSGCSFSSISGAVRRLVRLGAISFRREKTKSGWRNVYTVFRTLQASSGTRSRTTEYPLAEKKRDALGRFHSKRAEDPRSRATEYPHSRTTEQNKIYLNKINGTRLKGPPPPPPKGGNGRASETSARPVGSTTESTTEENTKREDEEKRFREKIDRIMRERLAR